MPDLSPKLMAALVLLAAIAFALSPVLSEPFTGFNPDQLPRPVDNPPIQPAGYAFAIWGVIYLWLIVGAGFGLFKRADTAEWQAMRPALLVSIAVGASWIPVALTAPVPATLLIIAMLITALIALFRAPLADAALGAAPVALYAGWLSAASIVASATIVAAYTGLDLTIISIVGLVIIGVVASLVIRYTAHPLPYAAAVIWALVGVVVTNSDADTMFVLGAAVGIIIVVAFRTVQRLRPQT
ncbi:tryptophan-rich sensory protein [Jannaschia sp. CCS1]|uniref:tryptophan-rich sensory protein n=1 Tax=Jannaschia sp. (strain CCS1) TaxID=290400 RepID=UPI00006BFFBA|nr:hypothetical protein Jann_1069 [Jannaschia sp. CCS1]